MTDYDVVVIGAGAAGLSAGALLATEGKRVKALVETPYEELDRWDDRNLRQWLRQYTDDQVRKMHFSERGTAAYSCWPGQGWDGIKVMWPGFAQPVWRRRHLVFEPPFGVIQKPGLVGMYRPHWRAPNVDGLYFASETFRSRGIGTDRAAHAAVTVVEDYLGRRLPTFGDGWRY